MNPFNYSGPEFLVFYSVFVLFWGIIIRIIIHTMSPSKITDMGIVKDPYAIAYLKGGANELVRVVLVSLIDRDLIEVSQEQVKSRPDACLYAHKKIEQEVLKASFEPTSVDKITADPTVAREADTYGNYLKEKNFLFAEKAALNLFSLQFVAYVIALGIAVTKLLIALDRGKSNVEFLIILSFLTVFYFRALIHPKRTRAGEDVLSNLSQILQKSSLRIHSLKKGATNELALMVAVFGVAILPTETYPFAQTLFARSLKSTNGSSANCGSSCSSSCGGSSCGGGCGGGCGGCGS